jgi:hypothetical protein
MPDSSPDPRSPSQPSYFRLVRLFWQRFRAAERRAFDSWNRRLDRRVSLTIGSALVVLGAGLATKPVHTRGEFYSVVAQMIPVLMLVAAVNGRYFRERRDASSFDRFLIRGFWVVGLIGEAAALVVVARGHDSVILRGLVIYALLLVGVLLTIYAIHGPARVGSAASDRTTQSALPNAPPELPNQRD